MAQKKETGTMTDRRSFLKKAGVAGAATVAAPAVHAQSKTKIKWRLQTYAGAPLAAHVIKRKETEKAHPIWRPAVSIVIVSAGEAVLTLPSASVCGPRHNGPVSERIGLMVLT